MNNTGHRWLVTAVGESFVKEVFKLPKPDAGNVTVAVVGCGVCHTDLGFLYDGVRTQHDLPLN